MVEINENNPKQLLAVYGTLRLEQGNWKRLLKDKSTYKGTFETSSNFTMFGKYSGFPIVTPNGTTSIKIDVFEIEDNKVLQEVHRLEGFTGTIGDKDNWYDVMEITTPIGNAYMYIQYGEFNNGIINTGDWLNK